ncbi:MAG: 16S rRNA (uracil(1498)-N(3))-methyltransferase [Rhodocyclaceae bacterium]|nr:16S rRNA (uracil(1498)-N(3))-methyltransferase [Rhodocyclaceae bacterium]MDZ4216548.1 16S rRNA (uracil(1498)-N(3))-methyltransferase [Rhodocyclaceae bacterium]
MIPRFHCPTSAGTLAPGAHLDLPENIARHAVKVLRMREGDPLILFDGKGGEWQAALEKVGAGGTARAALRAFDERSCESPLNITLVQALPSGDKMDWIVEKSVELGVTAIQPVAAQRSVIRLSAERMERRVSHWNHIAAAACEQSGRNSLPTVAPILDLPQYLALAKAQNASRLMLAPQAETAIHVLTKPVDPIIIMIGPEGGWENSEIQAAHVAGFQTIRLGPRVLRTETAGAAVLAAMQSIWGDF